MLKVPTPVSSRPARRRRRRGSAPPSSHRRAGSDGTASTARRPLPPATAPAKRPCARAAAVSATASTADRAGRRRQRPGGSAGRRPSRQAAPGSAPRSAGSTGTGGSLAWMVAVPLGFVITAWPAYEFGFIKKDDVLDVFVGSGTDRYTRLAIVTLIWAVVTAVLVQLFIEGGRVLANRRRRRTPRRERRMTGAPLPLLGLREPHALRRRRDSAHPRVPPLQRGWRPRDRGRRGARRAVEKVSCRWCGAAGESIEQLPVGEPDRA